jgi:hypothetical protein
MKYNALLLFNDNAFNIHFIVDSDCKKGNALFLFHAEAGYANAPYNAYLILRKLSYTTRSAATHRRSSCTNTNNTHAQIEIHHPNANKNKKKSFNQPKHRTRLTEIRVVYKGLLLTLTV